MATHARLCRIWTMQERLLASLLGARMLLGAPGRTTRNKNATSSKDAIIRLEAIALGVVPRCCLCYLWCVGEAEGRNSIASHC